MHVKMKPLQYKTLKRYIFLFTHFSGYNTCTNIDPGTKLDFVLFDQTEIFFEILDLHDFQNQKIEGYMKKLDEKNQNRKLIELESVSKYYLEGSRKHSILQDVNISFNKGEIVVLLGRSGSGKSTLLNLLSGIDLPIQGKIIINDINLTTLSENKRTLFRRKHIGFVFQFFNLIPTLSVEDNLRLPLELNQIAETDQITSLLTDIGLEDRRSSYPDVLSGGEQQRIAIARSLIHDPDILLSDEPTGNLDFETGKSVIELLDRLVRKRGKTMIMATHSKELIGIADRIIAIKHGELVDVKEELSH